MIYRENSLRKIYSNKHYAYNINEANDGMQKKIVIGNGTFIFDLIFNKDFSLKATLFQEYNGVQFKVETVEKVSIETDWLNVVQCFFPEIKEII